MPARHTLGNTTQNFVDNRVSKSGVFPSIDTQALERSEQSRFDLLLTDHAMPGMTGIELASLMRGVDPNQRVILFTGYPMSPSETPSDISCLLKKPAQPEQLQKAIAFAMA